MSIQRDPDNPCDRPPPDHICDQPKGHDGPCVALAPPELHPNEIKPVWLIISPEAQWPSS